MSADRRERAIRIALLQHECVLDREVNLQTATAMADEAADRGAQLIVTQELFDLPYFPQTEDEAHFALAESIPGPTSDRLCRFAAQRGVYVNASVFERRAPGVFHNTSLIIDGRGRIVGRYRKMHIPDDPRYYEKFYFAPGDLGFTTHVLPNCCVGTLICWDQWFPEAARLSTLAGAELLLYPTAIGSWDLTGDGRGGGDPPDVRQEEREAWQTIQRSHAIANGVFVASVNRIGIEGQLKFWGSSFVVDPAGRIIARAPADDPAVLVVDCDLAAIDRAREGWPFLRDRRIDEYGDLAQRMLDP